MIQGRKVQIFHKVAICLRHVYVIQGELSRKAAKQSITVSKENSRKSKLQVKIWQHQDDEKIKDK